MNLARFNIVLLIVGLALAVMLTVLMARGAAPRLTPREQRADQYTQVVRAATAEVQAFLGIDYENVDAQTEIVLDGATGDFERQYADELDSLKQSARAQESVAVATVLAVGITDIDDTTARVLVAANTEVTSKAADDQARTVPWRIQLDLVNEGGRWLTSGLRFVG